MRRLLLGLSFVALGGLLGRAVGAVGEGERWVALALHAEPWGWLAAVLGAYLLVVVRRAGWGLCLVLAAFAASVGVRVGGAGLRVPLGEAPAWLSGVRQCAGALGAPKDAARILVWTVDGQADPDTIVRTVVGLAPDVAVLPRLPGEEVLARVQAALGGEATFVPEVGVGLYTRGEFPYCREESVWVEGGVGFTFVSLPGGATFPLAFVHTPAPASSQDWAREYVGAAATLGAVGAQLGAPGVVVVGDTSSTSAYRLLDDGLSIGGVHPVDSPANWPSRIGRVPFPALFPYDRAWAGEAWVGRATRLRASVGTHDPIWLELRPAFRAARYQRPPSESPPGVRVR